MPYTATTVAKLESMTIVDSRLAHLKQELSYFPRYKFPSVEKSFLHEVTYHSQVRRSPIRQGKGENTSG